MIRRSKEFWIITADVLLLWFKEEVNDIMGGCGWGVEWSSPNLKVGSSIPSLPNLHADVSLGKMLNPE